YIGHTGGGFDQEALEDLYTKMKPLVQTHSSFKTIPKTNTPATWLKPSLVCEVQFAGWTRDGSMRQPVFVGMRSDKKAKDVVQELPASLQPTLVESESDPEKKQIRVINKKSVALSNFSKIYWPKEKYTKGDLIAYYERISPFILPYIKDRPLSLHRFPDGIAGKEFYQKDSADIVPAWAKTIDIYAEGEDKQVTYLVGSDTPTLLFMANLGCIEIHTWNSRVKKLDYPDYLVMDLDPESVPFDHVIAVARAVHDVFDSLGITSICKTSGSRGLHVYVPMGGKYTYEQVREFSEIIASLAAKEVPKITSMIRSPRRRQHKVYFDTLQNRKGATTVAPYSVRPRPGATVSTPLRWEEVKKGLDPTKFTIKTIFKRLEKHGDLFAPILGKGIDMKKAIKKLERGE
ncbi:MAG: non-homologous end-joining DNA ligase, partial [Patescibacteria group bacterium]